MVVVLEGLSVGENLEPARDFTEGALHHGVV